MHNRIFCIHHDIGVADDVVDRLLGAGIERKQIGILTTKAGAARYLAMSQGRDAAEQGGAGASVGGAVGLLAGTLITAATSGVGVIAAGPLLTGLIGLSPGASTGSLVEILTGSGIPEGEARFCAQEIADNDGILICADVTDSNRDIVRHLMLTQAVESQEHA